MRLTASGDGLEPIERVLPKLQRVKKCGKGWAARCPAHKDKRPSMTVAIGKDGRVLLNCHKGCSYKDIMTAIGLQESDGFPAEAPVPQAEERPRAIVKTYDYRDEQGKVLFQTVRYAPKDFRQRHQNGNSEWLWNLEDVRRVLYRLPEVLAADPNVMVWLVEGEKDADYLASLGFLATTSPMGAKSWRAEYAEFLRGRHVVIVPDNDVTGHEYAGKVFASLQGKAASIKVLLLPDLKPSGDVSDWLDDGHTADELAALAEETEETEDYAGEDEDHGFTVHSAAEAFEDIPETDWVVEELLSTRSVAALVGAGGVGKTYICLDLAVCIALGERWLHRKVKQGPILIVDEESGHNRLRMRLRQVFNAHGAGPDVDVHWITLEAVDMRNDLCVHKLGILIRKYAPVLVIFDALVDVTPGADENKVVDMRPAMANLRRLADKHDMCSLVIHHANRMGSYRGSSVIRDLVDTMIKTEGSETNNELILATDKNRDGEKQRFGALLNINKEEGWAKLVPSLVAIPERRLAAADQCIINYLREYISASMEDLLSNRGHLSPDSIKHGIRRLLKNNQIQRVDNGKSGERAIYGLAEQPKDEEGA